MLSTGNVQNHSYNVGNLSVGIVVSDSSLKGKVGGSNLSREKVDEKVSLKIRFIKTLFFWGSMLQNLFFSFADVAGNKLECLSVTSFLG
jgi:hypothetical protein